jgi:hypothetical protein
LIVTDGRTLQIVILQCEYDPASPRCETRTDAINGNKAHDDDEDTPDDGPEKWQHIALVSGTSRVQDDENLPSVRDVRGLRGDHG